VARTGARILRLLTVAVAGRNETLPMGELLSLAWNVDARLINAALILIADHELNVSAFTARVVASADATPYAAVIAGLAALSGVKHGANVEQVTAFLREIGDPNYARQAIMERLQRGERIPGFGHRVYAGIDPRAETLLDLIRQRYPTPLTDAVLEAARDAIHKEPNIDLALGTLEQVAALPRGSGLALFALGRTVGWIGHAIEQYRSGEMIRPRARYVGEPPEGTS
jgi:citrate synthase